MGEGLPGACQEDGLLQNGAGEKKGTARLAQLCLQAEGGCHIGKGDIHAPLRQQPCHLHGIVVPFLLFLLLLLLLLLIRILLKAKADRLTRSIYVLPLAHQDGEASQGAMVARVRGLPTS